MTRYQTLLVILAVFGGSSCGNPHPTDMPIVRIGQQSLNVVSHTQDALWGVRDVLDLDGTIWALTGSAPFVHGFGPTGALTTTFGTGGEGPGEFRFPHSVWPGQSKGSLTIWDPGSYTTLTFSSQGTLLSSLKAPALGVIRADIATVTFGHPFRAFTVPGAIVAARYDSGVSHGNDLWNGRLVRVPNEGGEPETVIDFASELPGASQRSAAMFLAPVPLWDGCPDGRIAVLDPVARTLFMLPPTEAGREAVALPWQPVSLGTNARLAYMRSRVKAELGDQNAPDAEIERIATEAVRRAEDAFATDEPIGIDLKCATGRVWIQEFDGTSHPLGYGPVWRTVTFNGKSVVFSRVVFPGNFAPYRVSQSRAVGVVADSVGLQRVATVELPPVV